MHREGYASRAALQGIVRYRPLASLYEAALLPAKAIGLGHLSPRLVARRRPGMPVIATPATPPQPLAMVKVGYQPWDGSDLLHVKATKKKPRATAGLKLIERRYEKGPTG